ncbi:hypothetical protein D9611_004127 [Ephemerocybe angulata]|uniref:DUF6533 domain-containing protein n=1 Tax=Ephemerocybe angulata TaxID=980116 RepID=A0A8H5BJU0_9AGAR|nr:hypothetical protein D9611_004127 [Tulosesus angulatus]
MSSPSIQAILASAGRQKNTKYVDVAALALLVVDYIGTFEAEVSMMWKAKWSFAKALFFLTRYLAFFDVPLAIYFHTSLGLPPRTCQVLFIVETISLLVGVAVAEAILFLRVWALSGRNRKLLIYLTAQYTAVHLVEAVLFGHFLFGLEFGPSPLPTVIGCLPLPPKKKIQNSMLSALFGLILANELVILFITFFIGLTKFRDLRSPLIKTFYLDGFFYFLILSAISIGNMIVDLVGPPEYRFLIVVLQRVMHSVLSGRMILHLRGFANGSSPTGLSEGLTANDETGPPRFGQNPLLASLKLRNTMQFSADLSRGNSVSYFPGAHSEDIELPERTPETRKRDPERPI